MIALLITFPDVRATRIVRIYPTLEDMVSGLPAHSNGVRAWAAPISPDQERSILEHPYDAAERLLRYMDSIPEAERMEVL